ncbi:hypothetical protein ACMXYO_05855 [Neptuniibacter sp. QD37_6]|uniref:hypothetical protein n=1 Tax=Neptuniibacter sp. QD37_6 TaxID=3398210 RepID=UPI0039F521C5
MDTVEEYLSNDKAMQSLTWLAIRHSAWWDTHSSGQSVRAKGNANRVIWSPYFNEYILPFGKSGNKFVVGKAAKNIIRKTILLLNNDNPPNLDELIDRLKSEVTSSVANHENDFYYDYPTRGGKNQFMEFGSHSIAIEQFILVVLELSKQLSRYGKKYEFS